LRGAAFAALLRFTIERLLSARIRVASRLGSIARKRGKLPSSCVQYISGLSIIAHAFADEGVAIRKTRVIRARSEIAGMACGLQRRRQRSFAWRGFRLACRSILR
jgi:hypothetical protein